MPSDKKPGDTPRPKRARAKRAKPSFAATPPEGTEAGWAYRSDTPTPSAPAAKPSAPAAPREPAPRRKVVVPPARAGLPPLASRAAGALEHALDVLAVPIGIVVMAALAPVCALLAPRRKS